MSASEGDLITAIQVALLPAAIMCVVAWLKTKFHRLDEKQKVILDQLDHLHRLWQDRWHLQNSEVERARDEMDRLRAEAARISRGEVKSTKPIQQIPRAVLLRDRHR